MNESSSSATNFFLAGSIAGLVSDACVHPVDTIRAMQQTRTEKIGSLRLTSDILDKQGISRFYKGFGAVAVGTIPGHALYFAGYEYSKAFLYDRFDAAPKFGIHLAAGFVADVCGALVWTPMDVIKQRLQVSTPGSRNSSFKELVWILRNQGVPGLYRGFGASLLTYGPYVAIYFALYEAFKSEAISLTAQDHLPFYVNLLGAASAGALSAAVTCPADVIKTRIQVQQSSHVYSGIGNAFRDIIKKEGYRTLFSGVGPRAIWMSGGTAITMMVYEELKKY